MSPPLLSWLLRFAALCHLTVLLAGQHSGVKKCSVMCSKMTSEIPVNRLISYQRTQESCDKRAIILETKLHKSFCADPNEKWVQNAMKHLDRQADALARNGGTFEKQIGGITPATRATGKSAVSEPKATGESDGQEAQRVLGTSPELPTGVAGSWGPGSTASSKAPDSEPPARPERTELFSGTAGTTSTAGTTTTSWPSSAASQPEADLWAEGKASEAPATPAPPTQAPSTQAPSTQAPSTQALPTQALPTQAPSTQALPTQAPSTQAPSTQALPTQAPSTQAPTVAHTAPEDTTGPEGQSPWAKEQDPMPENSLGPKEAGPVPAHTDAFTGPDSPPQASVVPASSDGDSSREPVASGSWAPKAEETIHATVDPQRLGVLMTPVPDSQVATRRQAVGLLAFLGLLFCVGVVMFAYQSLQGCPRKMAGEVVEGLRYVPRSCGSNSYVLVPV
ncbi:Fractalkine [Galemys pyrenaicus]|uniref:Fractalkine n=1 Tax=Galemys pyrenaicus TaxID=202257 RepID=A0A8J6DYU1_GALPY|nr:Fractalkine [Galemys pyrenaicus]